MKNKRKAILLVGALLCLNLNIFSQNIPLKMNKVSVKKAMTELKEKSGYSEEGSRTVHVEREKITRYFRACDGCYGRTYRRS